MDAVEFLKTTRRMCVNMDNCTSCGLYNEHTDCVMRCFTHPEEIVAAVEKWAAEHPVKTRQSEFLKMFPNAPFSHNTIDICPSKVDVLQKCPKVTPATLSMCVFCMREYWLAEVD